MLLPRLEATFRVHHLSELDPTALAALAPRIRGIIGIGESQDGAACGLSECRRIGDTRIDEPGVMIERVVYGVVDTVRLAFAAEPDSTRNLPKVPSHEELLKGAKK